MTTVSIGSISIFVNTGQHEVYLSDEVASVMGNTLRDYFTTQLRQRNYPLEVTGFKIKRGCLIIELFLGIAIAGDFIKGAYDFVKDYPDLKKGAKEIADTLKGMFFNSKVQVNVEAEPEAQKQIIAALTDKALSVQDLVKDGGLTIIETKTKIFTTNHKLAVMREDLLGQDEFAYKIEEVTKFEIRQGKPDRQ